MDLSHEFVVALPVQQAWTVLTDLERVAPCMPGAQLDEIEGEQFRGRVRVKVGPVTVDYKGVATFLERDELHHRVVLRGEGRETKGQGKASATVTATLVGVSDDLTQVSVETALDISGRVAQFGRGALADVSAKLLGQFVENLDKSLAADGAIAAPADPVGSASEMTEQEPSPLVSGQPDTLPAAVRQVNSTPAEPVGVVGLLGATLLKRLGPIAVIGIVIAAISRRRRTAKSAAKRA